MDSFGTFKDARGATAGLEAKGPGSHLKTRQALENKAVHGGLLSC